MLKALKSSFQPRLLRNFRLIIKFLLTVSTFQCHSCPQGVLPPGSPSGHGATIYSTVKAKNQIFLDFFFSLSQYSIHPVGLNFKIYPQTDHFHHIHSYHRGSSFYMSYLDYYSCLLCPYFCTFLLRSIFHKAPKDESSKRQIK